VLSILVGEGDIVGASFAWAAIVDTGAQELDAVVSRGYPDEVSAVPPDVARHLDPHLRRRARSTGAVVSTRWKRSSCTSFEVPGSCTAAGSGACRCSTRPGRVGIVVQFEPRTGPNARRRGASARCRPGGAGWARAARELGDGSRYAPHSLLPSALPRGPPSRSRPATGRGTQRSTSAGTGDVITIDEHRSALVVGASWGTASGRERDGSVAGALAVPRPGIERAGVGGGSDRIARS
jgi:hypothetical protein